VFTDCFIAKCIYFLNGSSGFEFQNLDNVSKLLLKSVASMSSENRIHLDQHAASSIDAYFEYRNIVGDDDNGTLFTPEEYEAYKKKVIPQRMQNRLYVSWTNSEGMDCKLIGPETPCFCKHRYKQHKTDFELPVSSASSLKCKVAGCLCSGYNYIPKNGSQALKCHCKHSALEHSAVSPNACHSRKCSCNGFQTSYRCGCGDLAAAHKLLVETRQQRLERGHPVAKFEPPYAAMGGLTGLSSLIDGYMRLDESGVGCPTKEFLESASTSQNERQMSVSTSYQSRSKQAITKKLSKTKQMQ